MSAITEFLAKVGSAVEQLAPWNVLSQVVGTAGAPAFTELVSIANSAHPLVPLSPPDLADAVVRNFMGAGQAEAEAAKSGMDAERFRLLVPLRGDAPGPQQLAAALRRGLVGRGGTGPDSTSFQQGIAEGRLADKWAPVIEGLAKVWPSPADALRATLEGQVTREQGLALYEKLGGDTQFFEVLFNTEGAAPTPVEALELANRGIIPWDGTGPQATSYHQAFLEGPWRDKWLGAFRRLGEYLPPPETVRTLLGTGQITHKQAADLWRKNGLAADTIEAYTAAADFTST